MGYRQSVSGVLSRNSLVVSLQQLPGGCLWWNRKTNKSLFQIFPFRLNGFKFLKIGFQ